jgi:hypothetical protein
VVPLTVKTRESADYVSAFKAENARRWMVNAQQGSSTNWQRNADPRPHQGRGKEKEETHPKSLANSSQLGNASGGMVALSYTRERATRALPLPQWRRNGDWPMIYAKLLRTWG